MQFSLRTLLTIPLIVATPFFGHSLIRKYSEPYFFDGIICIEAWDLSNQTDEFRARLIKDYPPVKYTTFYESGEIHEGQSTDDVGNANECYYPKFESRGISISRRLYFMQFGSMSTRWSYKKKLNEIEERYRNLFQGNLDIVCTRFKLRVYANDSLGLHGRKDKQPRTIYFADLDSYPAK